MYTSCGIVLCIACGKPDLVFARYEAIREYEPIHTHFPDCFVPGNDDAERRKDDKNQ
jgi:hypothetical protein